MATTLYEECDKLFQRLDQFNVPSGGKRRIAKGGKLGDQVVMFRYEFPGNANGNFFALIMPGLPDQVLVNADPSYSPHGLMVINSTESRVKSFLDELRQQLK